MRLAEDDVRSRGARVAGHAEIRDVKATQFHGELLQEAEPGKPLSYEDSSTITFALSEDGGFLVVDLTWEMTIRQAEDDPSFKVADGERIAEILVALTSLYTIRPFDDEPDEPLSESELSAFAESSGKFALYPFVREAIHELTSRLSLPPLTLPMLKAGLTPQSTDEDES